MNYKSLYLQNLKTGRFVDMQQSNTCMLGNPGKIKIFYGEKEMILAQASNDFTLHILKSDQTMSAQMIIPDGLQDEFSVITMSTIDLLGRRKEVFKTTEKLSGFFEVNIVRGSDANLLVEAMLIKKNGEIVRKVAR